MSYRAYYLQDAAYNEVDQFNVTKRIFACTEPLHDEDWWLQAKRNIDQKTNGQLKDVVEQMLQQEAQAIFEKILTDLQDSAKEGQEITYKVLAALAGFDSHKGKTVKRSYALWEDHYKKDVQRTASGKSQRKPSATSHSDCDSTSTVRSAIVLKLWNQLTTKLKAGGLVWMDLPTGDELIATLCEMGFSAMQRIHLRKMLWSKRAVSNWDSLD